MALPHPLKPDLAWVQRIGIPRALLYWRYGELWEAFFRGLGREVVLSPETDKAIVEEGNARSIDECCLASKAYMGHVDALKGRCDAVFVPSYASCHPPAGFCTKFQGLPDLVRNTFRDDGLDVVSLLVSDIRDKKGTERAVVELGMRLGATAKQAKAAYAAGLHAQKAADKRRAAAQAVALQDLARRRTAAQASGGPAPLGILFVAHPYISHDSYLCGSMAEAFERMGATLVLADETPHDRAYKRSFDFSRTLPWVANRELIGSILMLRGQVDGIVLVSAFPCGPDSMTDDAIMRYVQGLPILNLTIDAQSGTAGVETRIESFVDILRYQKLGGYVG